MSSNEHPDMSGSGCDDDPDLCVECEECGGRGQIYVGGVYYIQCSKCGGHGWWLNLPDPEPDPDYGQKCPRCDGAGVLATEGNCSVTCPDCGGTSVVYHVVPDDFE